VPLPPPAEQSSNLQFENVIKEKLAINAPPIPFDLQFLKRQFVNIIVQIALFSSL
jgi:hypothetical protein